MMDPSKKDSFEEQWKKVFQEVSEIPPLSAWEGIEARLNKDEEKVIPLWWKTPRLWYAAASVAALLLVGTALWDGSYNQKQGEIKSQVAVNKSQNDSQSAKSVERSNKALNKSEKDKKGIIETEPALANIERRKNLSPSKRNSSYSLEENTAQNNIKNDSPVTSISGNNSVVSEFNKENKELAASGFNADKDQPEVIAKSEISAISITQDAGSRILAEALMPIGFKDLDVYIQKRYVFFKPNAVAEAAPKKDKKKEEYWANVDLMPASFNPNIKVNSAPTAYAVANASRQSLAGNSHPGGSYALQTQGAKRISKHWSVETGVNYLQGNSTYEGGGYLLDAATSRSENVLQSALADKVAFAANGPASNPTLGNSGAYTNTLYIDLNKEVRNDYRFLQVPVQAGFTINPDKKLSYSVLGGMMANFFINNEIESAAGSVITTKASDDVYRDLNYSATTGLRLNYRLSAKLKATLSGSYQKSLLSGFKNSETLDSHPSLYGVAWGVRYSF